MRRRQFILTLGAAAWPLVARAQLPAMPVIGYLNPGSASQSERFVAAFRQGLNETGYVEGRNASIEYRWAEYQYDRLPVMVADLIRSQVTMIAATGGMFSGLTAKGATATIPIVFIGTGDPVALGLVTSLNRPGGNVTGVTMLAIELLPKRLELLGELVPNVTIGVLVNPTNPAAKVQLQAVQEAARALGRQIVVLNAATEATLDSAFASLAQQQAGALLITSDTFLSYNHHHLAALTVRYAMPAIHEQRDFAVAGGLMSYGASFADGYRQAGIYAGRILKGQKPADLPVLRSTKVELVINLKAARTLGVSIPPPISGRADEVIE